MTGEWRSAVVDIDCMAEYALSTLDQAGLRMVLVVDKDGLFCGIVTDGDVRRALLRKVDFSTTPVSRIMKRDPVMARQGVDRTGLRAVMEKYSILHLPIVDERGCLTGLETYQTLSQVRARDNWVFLMAGGFGKRLAPLTDARPKPMLIVDGKPMLESILERFIAAGFYRFYISVFYLADQIKAHFGDGSRWGVTIRYVEEDEPLGTGGALGLLPENGGLPILMMNGDILTELDYNAFLDFHQAQQDELTMGVRIYDMEVPFGVVQGRDFDVTDIVEKPSHRFVVNAGIYVVSPAFLARTRPVRRVDMPDLVRELLTSNRKVSMFPIHEYWLDIGRREDFERAQIRHQ